MSRERAVELREQGRSYGEILDEIDVAKSTLSLWLRDVLLDQVALDRLAGLAKSGQRKAADTRRAVRIARQAQVNATARAQIPNLAESELFVAGVALYWAEGTKAKPWRTGEQVAFINSDDAVIQLFLAWLDLLGIEKQRLSFRISIHETADINAATEHWAAVAGIAQDRFMRPSLKRHKPGTRRRNIGDAYHGCLIVRVRASTDLNRQIMGWWQGLVAGAVNLERPSGMV